MLVAKVPVNLTGKRGITAESEILVYIEIVVRGFQTKIARGMRKPPITIYSPPVVIEISSILGIARPRASNHENRYCQEDSRSLTHNSLRLLEDQDNSVSCPRSVRRIKEKWRLQLSLVQARWGVGVHLPRKTYLTDSSAGAGT